MKTFNEILFAKDNTVWTASHTILSRYCGEKVDTFRVNGSISSLAEDNGGNLWIGISNFFMNHYEGLVKFDGVNWTTYNSLPDIKINLNMVVIHSNLSQIRLQLQAVRGVRQDKRSF